MIVPMKKYTFLIFYKEYLEFLKKIQELGVLHIIEKASGEIVDQELHDQYKLINEISIVIKSLQKRNVEKPGVLADDNNGLTLLNDIQKQTDGLEQFTQQLGALHKEYAIMEPWGYFDWETISRLSKSGIHIRFFTSSVKKYEEIRTSGIHTELIHKSAGTSYFVLIDERGEKQDIDADLVVLPAKSLRQIKDEELKIQSSVTQINKNLDEYAKLAIPSLEKTRSELLRKISFQKVVLHTLKEAEDKLMILEGWVPVDKKEEVDQFLTKEAVYYEIAEPVETDKVPIKLKNNKLVKLFEPIADLYALPNYFELDLTPLFVPFFMMFFGLCLGDAGYGIFILLVTTIAKMILKNSKLKPFMTLGQWLGVSTIVMGFISGTFFGIPLLEVEGLSVKKFMLSNKQLFTFSMMIGLVQIFFGLCVKAFNLIYHKGFKYSLSTIGWIILFAGIVVGYFMVKKNLIPSELKSVLFYSLLGVSGFLILVFNDPDSNPLISSLKGIWNVYGMVTGVFGDTLSYIRLFALGTSGAILGLVVNSIAMQFLNVSYIGPVLFIIFLIIGHSLVIALSALGAFVHPMRLTFVEFYKNAGFLGGGKAYKPFD